MKEFINRVSEILAGVGKKRVIDLTSYYQVQVLLMREGGILGVDYILKSVNIRLNDILKDSDEEGVINICDYWVKRSLEEANFADIDMFHKAFQPYRVQITKVPFYVYSSNKPNRLYTNGKHDKAWRRFFSNKKYLFRFESVPSGYKVEYIKEVK